MATSYGPWQSYSRIRWEYTYGNTVNGAVLVSVYAYLELDGSHSSNGTYPRSWWGTWGSGSEPLNANIGFGGSVLIVSWSSWITLSYGAATNLGFGASGSHYWGSASAELYFSLPARPYEVPTAPSSQVGSRVNDTQATVTWVRNATGAAPWSGVYIDRWSKSSNTWTRVANITSTATTWTDNGIAANNQYKYRIASYNGSGQSAWRETALFATTPSAPNNVQAEKVGTGDIQVTWTNTAVQQDGAIIYDNGVQVGTVGAGIETFAHSAPNPSVTHTYTIRATTLTPVLQSALSTPSNTVQLQAAPNASTNLRIEEQVTNAVLTTTSFENSPGFNAKWVHNPVDSSVQRKFQIRVKAPGDVTWRTLSETTSAVSSFNMVVYLGANGIWYLGTYEWQVRTWGAHADPSPWSASSVWNMENDPSITILDPTPGEVISASRTSIAWTYSQTQSRAQQQARVEVFEGATKVYSRTLTGTGTTHDIDYTFNDGLAYTITLFVTAANGLFTTPIQQVNITVDYAEPAVPNLTGIYDDNRGSNQISIDNPTGAILAEYNRVYRRIDQDLSWLGLADNVVVPEPVTNYAPSLLGPTTGVNVYWNRFIKPNPSQATITGWTYASSSSVVPGVGRQITYASAISAATELIVMGSNATYRAPVEGNVSITARLKITNNSAVAINLRLNLALYNSGGSQEATRAGTFITLNPGETKTLENTTTTNPTTVNVKGVVVTSASHAANTIKLIVHDGASVQVGTRIMLEPFSGSLPSPDRDLTAVWVGTGNNSGTYLVGQHPTAFTDSNCISIVHAVGDGTYKLRQIGTLAFDFYTTFIIPSTDSLRTGGYLKAKMEILAPLGGSPGSTSRSILVSTPNTNSPQTPNIAGTYPLEVQYGNLTSQYTAWLIGGNGVGNGDVYWSDIGLYKEAYNGPWFGEAGGGFSEDGLPYNTQWDGTPYQSTITRSYSFLPFVADEWEYMGEYPINTTFDDYRGLTTGTTIYLVEAVSNIPSTARTVVKVKAESWYYWVGGGADYSHTFAIPYNIIRTQGVEATDSEAHYFEGRDKPVLVTGEIIDHTMEITGTLDPSELKGSTWDEAIEIAKLLGPHMYRDTDGNRLYIKLSGFKHEKLKRNLRKLTFNILEVDSE